MTRHRLRRTDVDRPGSRSEHGLEGGGLGRIVGRRGRPVRVDVVDIVRGQVCVTQGTTHRDLGAQTARRGSRHVIGVRALAEPGQFRDDRSAPIERVVERLEDQHRRSFAEHESISRRVEGTRCRFGGFVSFGKRLHRRESCHAQRCDRRFRAPGDHHVGFSDTDGPQCGTHRMRAGRTGRDRRIIRTLRTVAHRYHARRHIADEHRDEERRNTSGTLREQLLMLVLESRKSPDTAAHDHAHPFG